MKTYDDLCEMMEGQKVIATKPNIFKLYEQEVGPLTPMIAEMLMDAEDTYPESWIEPAIAIAVENQVRRWSYIKAILEGWRVNGFGNRGSKKKKQVDLSVWGEE